MAETDKFNVEDLLNYEHEVGEGDPDKSTEIDDPELEAIKARVKAMEEESEKLKELQKEVDMQLSMPSGDGAQLNILGPSLLELKMDVDRRSVYIGNVDYGATAEELEQHFHGCGSISRVTILCNKFDGHPKGFAYVEFSDKISVQPAMALDDSLFRGRQIRVMPKRTNKPGITSTNRPPRGRGNFRARGGRGQGFGGGYMRRPRGGYCVGYCPY